MLLREGPDFRFEFVSQCNLPTDKGLFTLRAYRYTDHKTGKQIEPVALFCGELGGQEDVLMRVHDQCLTSEVLGSKRCDCKEQLELAMDKVMAEPGGGMILYLPQEGRGIGLANKVAAYALQEQGLDTVDANLALGFGDDERTYDYVPYILEHFGVRSVRLATNNPFKVRSLRTMGVEVTRMVPLRAVPNRYNLHYLRTKHLKMEHDLGLGLDEDEDEGQATSEGLTDSEERNSTTSDATSKGEEGDALVMEAEAEGPPHVEYAFGRETVVAAVQAIKEGKIVLVVDDEDRENEGDFIMAAEAATKETLAFIVRHGSGVVCVALEGDECDRLQLPPMVVDNQDPKKTAYTISVDARVNTTTGISAHDRAVTLRLLASSSSQPSDFSRPGHVFPLRYSEGGVLVRRGHTEASVDLARLAGKRPAGVLCEVVNDDGSMARLPELQVFAKTHGMVLTSIQDLCAYRLETEASSR